jgi:hypothetical protein
MIGVEGHPDTEPNDDVPAGCLSALMLSLTAAAVVTALVTGRAMAWTVAAIIAAVTGLYLTSTVAGK